MHQYFFAISTVCMICPCFIFVDNEMSGMHIFVVVLFVLKHVFIEVFMVRHCSQGSDSI